jgi:cell division protein FtsB
MNTKDLKAHFIKLISIILIFSLIGCQVSMQFGRIDYNNIKTIETKKQIKEMEKDNKTMTKMLYVKEQEADRYKYERDQALLIIKNLDPKKKEEIEKENRKKTLMYFFTGLFSGAAFSITTIAISIKIK